MKKIIVLIGLMSVSLIFNGCMTDDNKQNDFIEKEMNVDEDTIKDDPLPEAKEMPVKEFIMQSYSQMVDGKPAPRFSMGSLTVNKGDKVRIKITNTAGNHDFNLDEFDIHSATPLEEEVVIEFVADKTGKFEYYCSMPGHRANGHKGELIVME